MKTKIILFLLLTTLSISCTVSTTQKEAIPTINFEKNGKAFSGSDIECKFIALETTTDNLISSTDQVKIFRDRIYVLDKYKTQSISVYTLEGKFITKVGRKGNGPGEYNFLYSFMIDEKMNQIVIVDFGNKKRLYYDLDAYKYQKMENMPWASDCIQLSDGGYAFFSQGTFPTDKREFYFLKVSDSTHQQVKDYIPSQFPIINAYSGAGGQFHQSEGKTFFRSIYSPTVYEVSSTDVKPVYNLSFGKTELPPLDWIKQHMTNNQDYFRKLMGSGYICTYTLHETADYLHVNYGTHELRHCFYNKQTKEAYDYSFAEYVEYTAIEGIGKIAGVYDDYFISVLSSVENLKTINIQRPDLDALVKSLDEDSNPIICLFKFK